MAYASQTSVSVAKSRAEIEALLHRYGASQFIAGWNGDVAAIGFVFGDRAIRMELQLPDPESREFTHTPSKGQKRAADAAEKAWEQACRSRWRALLLVVKAKLEACEVGISTIEEEFLAWTVVPGAGRTVYEAIGHNLVLSIESGEKPQLLLGGGGANA